MNDDLRFAHELADLADPIAMSLFRSLDLRVERKADLTEVTQADRQVEERIREHVGRRRPSDTVLGEEFGGDLAGTAGSRWIIDPIDGTRSFIRGYETWACLIALQHDGETVCAVASVPCRGDRYAAARGEGATVNGVPIHVSSVDQLDQAMLAHTSLPGFIRAGTDERLRRLAARCWDGRGMGNSLSHLSVARGSADIGWTSRANLWDFAALAIIVEEAGGRFTDRSADSPIGGPGVSSNGLLHTLALEAAGIA
ncbi:MAG: inositol monophosphatase family protein [Candidatus Dormibacteria bacterium]|jgi:histidinol-phosphatase